MLLKHLKKVYHFRRWFILGSFCFLTFVNGVTLVAYSTIIEEAKTYYSVSDTQILWFVWQFNITYVMISFPVDSLIEYHKYPLLVFSSNWKIPLSVSHFREHYNESWNMDKVFGIQGLHMGFVWSNFDFSRNLFHISCTQQLNKLLF